MTLSWTLCDCCGSREDVHPVEGLGWDPDYLCVLCRRGLCPECAA